MYKKILSFLLLTATLLANSKETCYSVQIFKMTNTPKNLELLNSKSYDSSCRMMHIKKNIAIRCGCYATKKEVKIKLLKLKQNYNNSSLVVTYAYRFKLPQKSKNRVKIEQKPKIVPIIKVIEKKKIQTPIILDKEIPNIKIKKVQPMVVKEKVDIAKKKVIKTTLKKVWKDKDTNLVWQVNIDKKIYNWRESKEYCKNLILNNSTHWRLPTHKELNSLLKDKQIKKALLETLTMKYKWFWSETESNNNHSKAWSLNFGNSYGNYFKKSDSSYVRCVKDKK